MPVTQVAFRARNDNAELNAASFDYGPDTHWTQGPGVFRVRFALSGAGTVPGQLEASTSGTAGWFNVTDTSGTVQAARSSHFAEGDATSALLTDSGEFVGGYADEEEGLAGTVTLAASEHTELEYCLRLVPQDVSAGGTIHLRVDGVDTYARTAQLVVGPSSRDRVRRKVGDTTAPYKLSDAEIDAHVAEWPNNVTLAAANAAEAIAAKYAEGYNFTSDGQSFNRRERFLHYRQLAAALRSRGGALAWPR